MLVVSIWSFPQPLQEAQIKLYAQLDSHPLVRSIEIINDGTGLLRPQQILQPSDIKPIQKVDDVQKVQKNDARRTKTAQNIPDSEIDRQTEHIGRDYSKEEVKALIVSYSEQYGIDSALPLCIANKESGYQDKVISPSGKYFGTFQYDLETWSGTDEGKAGMNVLDANANVKAAVKYFAIHKKTNPWKGTAKGCPGLIFTNQ